MTDPKPREPGEGCTRMPDGSVSDELFHGDILDNPEAERSSLLRCREHALAQGMTQAEVDKYLPFD